MYSTHKPSTRRSSEVLKASATKKKRNLSPDPAGSSKKQVSRRKASLMGESKIPRARPANKSVSSVTEIANLATIFGGTLEPKLAKENKTLNNQVEIDEAERVRQAKQKALTWIREECKKYD